MIWLFALFACPAEDLGIVLPPSGIAATSMEDLVRDRDALATAQDGGAAWMRARLGQMGLTVQAEADGAICGRSGEGAAPIELWATPADGPVGAAALISVAKAFDLESDPPRRFCWGPSPGPHQVAHMGLAPTGEDVDLRTVLEGVRAAARQLTAG
jgi:hypothetical protein